MNVTFLFFLLATTQAGADYRQSDLLRVQHLPHPQLHQCLVLQDQEEETPAGFGEFTLNFTHQLYLIHSEAVVVVYCIDFSIDVIRVV